MSSFNANPIFPQILRNSYATILPADTTTQKTLITAGPSGTIVESIIMTGTDNISVTYTVNLSITNSTASVIIGALQGNLVSTGSAPINFFNTAMQKALLNSSAVNVLNQDSNGNPYLYLAAGNSLTISVTSAVTSGKQITAVVQGGDY